VRSRHRLHPQKDRDNLGRQKLSRERIGRNRLWVNRSSVGLESAGKLVARVHRLKKWSRVAFEIGSPAGDGERVANALYPMN
jgi:hypothetical protein